MNEDDDYEAFNIATTKLSRDIFQYELLTIEVD